MIFRNIGICKYELVNKRVHVKTCTKIHRRFQYGLNRNMTVKNVMLLIIVRSDERHLCTPESPCRCHGSEGTSRIDNVPSLVNDNTTGDASHTILQADC